MEFQTTQNDCLHQNLILVKLSNFRFIPITIESVYERKKSYQYREEFFFFKEIFWLKIHSASIFCAVKKFRWIFSLTLNSLIGDN